MNRVGRPLRWASGALASGLVLTARLSLPDLAGALAVVLVVVLALCWVIKDSARTRRLATLVRAWRDPSPREELSESRRKVASARQRRSQVAAAPFVSATLILPRAIPSQCPQPRLPENRRIG